jgi:S1-C subfamily serine protease
VVTVESYRGKEGALGSGVAVSTTEILTNCHVIEGAKKILVKQDKKEWVAKASRSDPASDRCVLSVPEGNFKPAPGVRPYDELKVGEPLYTLGSPDSFELTLGSGILSGLREEDGRQWVQTTAPISPGSSGGGLFDARGNVVGITTLILAGRQKRNQALNFAIPADSYWQP